MQQLHSASCWMTQPESFLVENQQSRPSTEGRTGQKVSRLDSEAPHTMSSSCSGAEVNLSSHCSATCAAVFAHFHADHQRAIQHTALVTEDGVLPVR